MIYSFYYLNDLIKYLRDSNKPFANIWYNSIKNALFFAAIFKNGSNF